MVENWEEWFVIRFSTYLSMCTLYLYIYIYHMYSVHIRWIEDVAFQRHAVAALGTSNIGHVRIHASTNSDLVAKRPTYSVISRESCCSISFVCAYVCI